MKMTLFFFFLGIKKNKMRSIRCEKRRKKNAKKLRASERTAVSGLFFCEFGERWEEMSPSDTSYIKRSLFLKNKNHFQSHTT